MPNESLSLPFFIIFVAVTALALPSTANRDFLRLPSDDVSASLCPDPITPGSCPVKCFRTAPVCGVNNVTYWCGCAEAVCAGTRVAKLGFCEFENGGSGPVSVDIEEPTGKEMNEPCIIDGCQRVVLAQMELAFIDRIKRTCP
ncbi:unnamed protein product [Lactuca virosa]|uniref:Uncharacterized protein n=1 Tax=Lactuca virosa TaxID=75947 RepID=A0AAU9ME70_9ASTR|nr:unnamed protein product [Lactuca virosa]